MNDQPIDTQKPWMRSRGSAQVRSVVIASLVATLALASAGCLVTPRRADSSPPDAPPVPQADVATPQADTAPASAMKTDFHAKATDRQRFQVHIDFGRAFEAQGNFDAAVLEYQDALTVLEKKRHGAFRPGDEALAHRRMAGALDRLGRFAQADTHYKKALKASPKDPRVWNDAGYSYYLQGRWADAERALMTAAKLAPDDERIRVNLGLTLAAQGRTESALPLLSHVSGDAVGHANLGYLLASTGQFDLARHQYEQALALRPDFELPRRALARIEIQQRNPRVTGTTPNRVAERTPSAAHPVDSRMNQASTASVKIPPPQPPHIMLDGRAVSTRDSQASSAPSRVPDLIPIPPPPPL
jgi:Flp pilus assembly protein TadD